MWPRQAGVASSNSTSFTITNVIQTPTLRYVCITCERHDFEARSPCNAQTAKVNVVIYVSRRQPHISLPPQNRVVRSCWNRRLEAYRNLVLSTFYVLAAGVHCRIPRHAISGQTELAAWSGMRIADNKFGPFNGGCERKNER